MPKRSKPGDTGIVPRKRARTELKAKKCVMWAPDVKAPVEEKTEVSPPQHSPTLFKTRPKLRDNYDRLLMLSRARPLPSMLIAIWCELSSPCIFKKLAN